MPRAKPQRKRGSAQTPAAARDALPSVLLGYQQELLLAIATHQVTLVEKSRRIGATWAVAADAALRAAATRADGGQDVFYIGFNLDMTREFVDTVATWAREFQLAAGELQEFLFRDEDDRDIQAFRVKFASGFDLVALCSRPRSLRGRQGYVIVDEAAFHDELSELLKAAMALLIWGGKLLLISTHDGVDNPFNQLVNDVRAGRKPSWALVRVTFDDAIADGLYRRVCLTRGIEWTADSERQWVKEIREHYGDGAEEELDCVPRQSGGRYLPRTLLEARVTDAPVLRWSLPDSFVDLGEEDRYQRCRDWCDDNLGPLLSGLTATSSALGEDFGRSGDLTVLWPVLIAQNLRRVTPFVVELRNVPFVQQKQVLFYVVDHLPRCSGVALDARGNGQYLAEVTRQQYGAERVSEVMLSEAWYREHMPRLRAGLEDGTFTLPRDSDVVEDFHALEVVRGVARPSDKPRQSPTGQRHSDAAVAAAMAQYASTEIDGGPIEFSVAGSSVSAQAFGGAIPRPAFPSQ